VIRWYRRGPRTRTSNIAYLGFSLGFGWIGRVKTHQVRTDGHDCYLLTVEVDVDRM
jgi:hypothetical protein